MSATIYAKITLLFAVLTALLMAIGYAVGLYFGDPYLFMLLGLGLAAVGRGFDPMAGTPQRLGEELAQGIVVFGQ